jgi:hypothetical protein
MQPNASSYDAMFLQFSADGNTELPTPHASWSAVLAITKRWWPHRMRACQLDFKARSGRQVHDFVVIRTSQKLVQSLLPTGLSGLTEICSPQLEKDKLEWRRKYLLRKRRTHRSIVGKETNGKNNTPLMESGRSQ